MRACAILFGVPALLAFFIALGLGLWLELSRTTSVAVFVVTFLLTAPGFLFALAVRIERAAMKRPILAYEEALRFNQRGLFIGGCPKSGTTLLLSLLDGHPQLAVLPEETFYLENRRRYRALKTPEARLQRLLERSDLRLLAHGRFEPKRECSSTSNRRPILGFALAEAAPARILERLYPRTSRIALPNTGLVERVPLRALTVSFS
jgi:hypothetical protein